MLTRILFAIAAVLLLTRCANINGPVTQVDVLVAAESSQASKAKKIAIMPFDGDTGRNLTSDIESMLANVKVGGKPFFQVVERERIDRVTREIQFSQTGVVSKESTKKLGHILGVNAMYMGNVTAPQINTNRYKETRSVCVQEGPPRGKLKLRSCVRHEDRQVSCSKTEATFSFTPKLIDTQTAAILFSEKITGKAEDAFCEDKGSASKTSGQLLSSARESALNTFIRKVAPTSIKRDLHLMEATESVKNEVAVKKIVSGLEFAKAGRLDRACEFWQEALTMVPEENTVIYNLGVCAEADGKMDVAKNLYTKVDRKLDKPDSRVTAALQRIKDAETNSQKIVEQIR